MPDRPRSRRESPQVRPEELGGVLRRRRDAENLSLAEAAKESEVSASTLSRLERRSRGEAVPTPDTSTLAKVARWLGVSLRLEDDDAPEQETEEDEPLPDIVEAHLRADRNLSSKNAAMLGQIFRATYDRFASGESEGDKQEQ